jgi:hypothetical protein
VQKRRIIFDSVEIFKFPVIYLFSTPIMRMTPAFPREEEASQAEHHLDPHRDPSFFFKDVSANIPYQDFFIKKPDLDRRRDVPSWAAMFIIFGGMGASAPLFDISHPDVFLLIR